MPMGNGEILRLIGSWNIRNEAPTKDGHQRRQTREGNMIEDEELEKVMAHKWAQLCVYCPSCNQSHDIEYDSHLNKVVVCNNCGKKFRAVYHWRNDE